MGENGPDENQAQQVHHMAQQGDAVGGAELRLQHAILRVVGDCAQTRHRPETYPLPAIRVALLMIPLAHRAAITAMGYDLVTSIRLCQAAMS